MVGEEKKTEEEEMFWARGGGGVFEKVMRADCFSLSKDQLSFPLDRSSLHLKTLNPQIGDSTGLPSSL